MKEVVIDHEELRDIISGKAHFDALAELFKLGLIPLNVFAEYTKKYLPDLPDINVDAIKNKKIEEMKQNISFLDQRAKKEAIFYNHFVPLNLSN